MFRRESARERALLRLIDRQQQQIDQLLDRVMYLSGRQWGLAPVQQGDDEPQDDHPLVLSALDVLPHEWAERAADARADRRAYEEG